MILAHCIFYKIYFHRVLLLGVFASANGWYFFPATFKDSDFISVAFHSIPVNLMYRYIILNNINVKVLQNFEVGAVPEASDLQSRNTVWEGNVGKRNKLPLLEVDLETKVSFFSATHLEARSLAMDKALQQNAGNTIWLSIIMDW